VFRVDEIRSVSQSLAQDSITSTRVNEGITGKWWFCGPTIYQMSEPGSNWKPYQVCTIYFHEGVGYTIGQGGKSVSQSHTILPRFVMQLTSLKPLNLYRGISIRIALKALTLIDLDATSESMKGKWRGLNFEHDENSFSSILSAVGTFPTLRCHRSDAVWPQMLLPDIYHGPHTPHQQYGGLKGSLSIFLALLAFSARPNELERALRRIRAFSRWQCWSHDHGSMSPTTNTDCVNC
jgi:hypothetical protein